MGLAHGPPHAEAKHAENASESNLDDLLILFIVLVTYSPLSLVILT